MRLYKDSEKTTFGYWFAHWRAFQKVAFQFGIWKPKYLLHDIEKPWMYLFIDKKAVKVWHRKHNRHHLGYTGHRGYDWEAMVIDWECSRFSKAEAPMNARDTLQYQISRHPEMKDELNEHIPPILAKLGL